MVTLGQKVWKTILQEHWSCSVKKLLKKAPNIREMIPFWKSNLAKAIAHAKAIAFARWSVWVQCQKHAKITRPLELFCAKNRSKKHQIFEKWDHFAKHAKNDSTRPLEFAKNRSKKHQIFEKWDHFENLPSCKGYAQAKIADCHLGSKIKNAKHMRPFYKKLELFCAENRCAPKNETILKIGHLAKAIAHAKPMQRQIAFAIVSLGQKWKFQICEKRFYKNIWSCSVQKAAPKNTKYSRNETILQRL